MSIITIKPSPRAVFYVAAITITPDDNSKFRIPFIMSYHGLTNIRVSHKDPRLLPRVRASVLLIRHAYLLSQPALVFIAYMEL